MMNTELVAKPWWASKGVIGGAVALVAGVLGVAEADMAQATDLVIDICRGGRRTACHLWSGSRSRSPYGSRETGRQINALHYRRV